MYGVYCQSIADSASHAAAGPFAELVPVLTVSTVVFLIGHVTYEGKSVPEIRVVADISVLELSPLQLAGQILHGRWDVTDR